MFSRAIPSPLCQGGHCHPPGTPVIHSQAQRAVCPALGPLTPDPARRGITTRAPRTIVCLQHGADLSPCEVSQEKSETNRASCPRVSGECQAEPKGSNVLLIPLAPPIVPETGTHTQTLSQTHTHKHTNKRYTQIQYLHCIHTYTYKSTNVAHTYNTHEHTFTHKHMNIRTQHTNIRHRDHSHTSIHNTEIQIYTHTTLHSHTQTYKHAYKHTCNTY